MFSNGIATPAQLAILTAALDEYCARHAITSPREREDAAAMILMLHDKGVTDSAEIARRLDTRLSSAA